MFSLFLNGSFTHLPTWFHCACPATELCYKLNYFSCAYIYLPGIYEPMSSTDIVILNCIVGLLKKDARNIRMEERA